MRISEILKEKGTTFSLEVFPPKTSEKYTETAENARQMANMNRSFDAQKAKERLPQSDSPVV